MLISCMVRFSSCLCFCSFSGAVLDSEFPVQPLWPNRPVLGPQRVLLITVELHTQRFSAGMQRKMFNVGKCEKKRELSFLIQRENIGVYYISQFVWDYILSYGGYMMLLNFCLYRIPTCKISNMIAFTFLLSLSGLNMVLRLSSQSIWHVRISFHCYCSQSTQSIFITYRVNFLFCRFFIVSFVVLFINHGNRRDVMTRYPKTWS